MKKRFLITYKNRNISRSNASNILGIPSEKLYEGVSFMAESNIPKEDDMLHFDKMGISSAGLTDEQVVILVNNQEVLAVEEDLEMQILGFEPEEQTVSTFETKENEILWNIELTKAPQAWRKGITGEGINLAILDTGIGPHPNLVLAGGVSFVDGVKSYNDGNGHGTHCAGTAAGRKGINGVYGVAKDANLFAIKVLGDNGSGYSSWIISGMEWCIQNNIHVASMSLGSASPPSIAYAEAIKNCEDNGVTIVCASGNGYQSNFPWVASPANSFNVNNSNCIPLAVGAIDQNMTIAHFSSRGTRNTNWNPVNVVAPGISIYSTYKDGKYRILQGTSMACPHVAGLVALVKQRHPNYTSHQISQTIMQTTQQIGLMPIPNEAYGFGLIDCNRATI